MHMHAYSLVLNLVLAITGSLNGLNYGNGAGNVLFVPLPPTNEK